MYDKNSSIKNEIKYIFWIMTIPSSVTLLISDLPKFLIIQVLQNALWQKSQPNSFPPSLHHLHCSSRPSASWDIGPLVWYLWQLWKVQCSSVINTNYICLLISILYRIQFFLATKTLQYHEHVGICTIIAQTIILHVKVKFN